MVVCRSLVGKVKKSFVIHSLLDFISLISICEIYEKTEIHKINRIVEAVLIQLCFFLSR